MWKAFVKISQQIHSSAKKKNNLSNSISNMIRKPWLRTLLHCKRQWRHVGRITKVFSPLWREGKVKGGMEDKMPSYATTIKADEQWCEPDPCGGQCTTGCSAAVCETCGFFEAWDFPSNKGSCEGALAGRVHSPTLFLSFTRAHRQNKNTLGLCGPSEGKVD